MMRSRDRYAELLSRVPVMPADEQRVVAERYAATRDPRDAERLVLGNQRLVVKIATEMGGYHRADLMDLVQEGNAGLLHAIDKFDPRRGTKLSSYAALWIRAFIMRHLMDTCRIVRLSSTRLGRRHFFGRTLPGSDVSLDARISHEKDSGAVSGRTVMDTFADDDAHRPDTRFEERERQARLRVALADLEPQLDPRERAILQQRLLSESPTPLRALARRFAVTGERTRQLEQRLVQRLRAHVTQPSAETHAAA